MSENYYMYGYREPDQDLIDEVGELNVKIEDLELEISRLEDELSNAISVEWLERKAMLLTANKYDYCADVIRIVIKEWEKENE